MDEQAIKNLISKHINKTECISSQHELIREIRRIRKNHGDLEDRICLVEGIGVHQKLLAAGGRIRQFLFCPEKIYSRDAWNLLGACMERAEKSYVISRKLNEMLADRDEPDGFLSLAPYPDFDRIPAELPDAASLAVILDGLEKPGNIGTILRSCDGAGVDAVLFCNRRVRKTNPNLIKSSMGAVFHVPILEFSNTGECIDWLIDRNYTIYLADTRAETDFKCGGYSGNTAIIMGSERFGISKEWYRESHSLISIPMVGICDSLNVGVAASILLYEASPKIRKHCTSTWL